MDLSDSHQDFLRDFREFGQRIDLPSKIVDKEIGRFSTPSPGADALIKRSFLSDELKQMYLRGYHYRQATLRP